MVSVSRPFPHLPRPLLFAHRGASWELPENTLPAFARGLEAGAQVLEMDVHLSRDGEVVVCHDASLERTTNGRGLVRALSYAELEQLNAAARFRGTLTGDTYKIPRLREVLEAFPQACFNIEIKQREPDAVTPTLEVLQGVDPERVLLTAGDHTIMQALEAAQPAVPLGLSAQQCWLAFKRAWWGEVPECFRGRSMQIPPRIKGLPLLWPRVIRRLHQAGLELHLWTINDAPQAQALLAMGVDGIMTDHPAALAAVMNAARGCSPA